MILKQGFLLRDVAGQTVVIPVGETVDLNTIITLNETGKFLWQQLETEKDEAQLTAALLAEYDVDEETAKAHVAAFVDRLRKNELLA